jgi:hypothetical protein
MQREIVGRGARVRGGPRGRGWVCFGGGTEIRPGLVRGLGSWLGALQAQPSS